MKTVIIGSENPVKVETAKEAFTEVFPDEEFQFIPFLASSGVSEQPFGLEETMQGAINRSDACKVGHPEGDFFIGLEGGVEYMEEELWAFAWITVQDTQGRYGHGRTGSFLLPVPVCELIKDGEELGVATDIVFKEVNSKHKGGTVGALTNGLITRKDFYTSATIFALIPFVHPELY